MKTFKETRGRKAKDGEAKSSTQRSKELRERDALAIATARIASDYEKFSDRLLIKAISDAMTNGYQQAARLISAEIIKRAHPDIALAKLSKDGDKR